MRTEASATPPHTHRLRMVTGPSLPGLPHSLRPSRAGRGRRVSVATIRRQPLDRLLIVNQRHTAAVLHAFERPTTITGLTTLSPRPLPHTPPSNSQDLWMRFF